MSTPFTWKDRVDAALAGVETSPAWDRGNTKLVASFRSPAPSLVREAAARRGVTVSGFVRRATLAMVAQTLGMDYLDVVAADPTIQLAGEYFPAPDPSGRIGGPWEIVALR